MCTAKEWSDVYEEKELAIQLKERMTTGMGRSFIIRDNGKIVAHDATSAETEDIVVLSGLIVKEEYVNEMYGLILSIAMDKIFANEGKEKYFTVFDKGRKKVFEKIGNVLVSETGKLVKKGC